jgi:hypothetical protein
MNNRKRVPAEFLGKARQFCLKHAQTSDFFRSFAINFCRKLSPSRKMRPERFIDLNRQFRLCPKLLLEVKSSNSKNHTLFSCSYITYTNLTDDKWAENEVERNLIIERFSISNKEIIFDASVSIGLHALTRWFERAPDVSEGALIENLKALCSINEVTTLKLVAVDGGLWIGTTGQFPKIECNIDFNPKKFLGKHTTKYPSKELVEFYSIRTYYSPTMFDDFNNRIM